MYRIEKVNRVWNCESLRQMCIKNNYFTHGNSTEYDTVLNFVQREEPTDENIVRVATAIHKYSDGCTPEYSVFGEIQAEDEEGIQNMVYMILNEVVNYLPCISAE